MHNRSFFEWIFDQVDNRALIIFRVFFGILLFAETAGAIATGWVRKTLIEPQFTFSFIDFPWLQPLPGYGMYFYFGLMAICGIMVALGWRYRWSLGIFTILWTGSYLMQKTHYNNHYYLLVLLCLLMLIVPANSYYSLDVKRDPSLKKETCPRWCYLIFITQLWIVYTWAGIVKFYPGWLDGDFIHLVFFSKRNYWLIGGLLQKDWLQKMVVYGGIVFDLFIIYILLWRRTRILGLALSAGFHLFNSIVFGIGIFPYLMLAMDIFFFSPEQTQKIFFKRRPLAQTVNFSSQLNWNQKSLAYSLLLYLVVQAALPLRQYAFKGNVFWTEEGHRMSWRMMLRSKYGTVSFRVVDKDTGIEEKVDLRNHLYKDQIRSIGSQPDMIWQFVQYLKQFYSEKGKENIEIYATTRISLNGSEQRPIIDPEVDLTKVRWEPFKHSSWILSYPD